MDINSKNPQSSKTGIFLLSYLSAIMLVLASGKYIGNFSVVSIAAFAVFAAIYTFVIDSGNIVAAVVPPIVAIAAFFVNIPTDLTAVMQLISIVFALISAFTVRFFIKNKSPKSGVFAALTAVTSINIVSNLLLFVYAIYGKLDGETVKKAVSDVANLVGNMYKTMMSTAYSAMGMDTETVLAIDQMIKNVKYSIKSTVPSTIVIYAMAFSGVVFLVFGLTAKILYPGSKEQLKKWRFSMTNTSVGVFYAVMILNIVFMLMGSKGAFATAFANLDSVLMVPFGYIGVRSLYNKLNVKMPAKILSVLIIAGACYYISMLLGLSFVISILSFIGASAQLKENYQSRGAVL